MSERALFSSPFTLKTEQGGTFGVTMLWSQQRFSLDIKPTTHSPPHLPRTHVGCHLPSVSSAAFCEPLISPVTPALSAHLCVNRYVQQRPGLPS